jgi:hypothetical protein
VIATRTRSHTDQKNKEPRPRGFSRYQEVASRRWDEAQQRQRAPVHQTNPSFENPTSRRPHSTMVSPLGGLPQYSQPASQHAYRNSDHSNIAPSRYETSVAPPVSPNFCVNYHRVVATFVRGTNANRLHIIRKVDHPQQFRCPGMR